MWVAKLDNFLAREREREAGHEQSILVGKSVGKQLLIRQGDNDARKMCVRDRGSYNRS